MKGGARPNAGRKKKGYRATTVAFRVREEIADTFKIQAKALAMRLTAKLAAAGGCNADKTPSKP